MKWMIFSIRDRATVTFARPWFMPTRGGAIRAFGDEINRNSPDNPLFGHPDDYDLYYCGDFDDQEGTFATLDRPQQVAVGKDMKIRT